MLFKKLPDKSLVPFSPRERVTKAGVGEVTLPANAEAIFSDAELAECGLVRAEPVRFVPPAGKIAVGEVRYVEAAGVVEEVYDLADAPPPPPEPTEAEKLARMAGDYGFAAPENLKAALDALTGAR